jgi:glycosyl transferase family 2
MGETVDSIVRSGEDAGAEVEIVVAWQASGPAPVYPGARVVDVFPVSLSYARNRGFRETRAALIAFVDDDELVDSRWVRGVVSAFDELSSAAGAFGPVAPLDDLARAYCRYEGDERRVFSGRRTGPWFVGTGGNMAFRRAAFATAGGFDLRFGAGAAAHAAEDWDVIVRLLRGGRTLVWSPQMVVYHPTKDDASHLASRFPYGFGVGHLARRHRDPLLALRYSKAIGEVLFKAGRGRDRGRLREGLATLGGFVAGGLSRARPLSPAAALEQMPDLLKKHVVAESWRPLEMVLDSDPQLRYRSRSGRFLHVHVNPPPGLGATLEALPATHRVVPGRDSLWIISRG